LFSFISFRNFVLFPPRLISNILGEGSRRTKKVFYSKIISSILWIFYSEKFLSLHILFFSNFYTLLFTLLSPIYKSSFSSSSIHPWGRMLLPWISQMKIPKSSRHWITNLDQVLCFLLIFHRFTIHILSLLCLPNFYFFSYIPLIFGIPPIMSEESGREKKKGRQSKWNLLRQFFGIPLSRKLEKGFLVCVKNTSMHVV
jgi:hypothetical protein